MSDTFNFDTAMSSISQYLHESQLNCDLQSEHQAGAGAVFELEGKLRSHYDKKYALCFSNATTAIHAVAMCCNMTCDSEVITSPINWGGSVGSMLLSGCKVVFTPVDRNTLCINPSRSAKAITKRTKAVLSVDYGGMAADGMNLKRFCEERGVLYVSDSSQSLGAYRDGKAAGHFADVIVTSFTAGKPLFGGEGGAVLTDDHGLHERLVLVSQHPARQRKELGLFRQNPYAPLNGRMNPLSAIWINERFDQSLIDVRRKQERFFAMLDSLARDEWIRPKAVLSSPTCSTFHNCFVEPFKRMSSDVVIYINSLGGDFRANEGKPTLIHNDPIFVKQFSHRFRVVGRHSLPRRFVGVNWKEFEHGRPNFAQLVGGAIRAER